MKTITSRNPFLTELRRRGDEAGGFGDDAMVIAVAAVAQALENLTNEAFALVERTDLGLDGVATELHGVKHAIREAMNG